MARLTVTLLGPLHVSLDGQPVDSFGYDKVRALLAYLAVESHRPHDRSALAALLWPGEPDAVARKNLRTALATLRQAIDDARAVSPLLLVTRDTIQFDPAGDYQLDVTTFTALLAEVERHGHPAGELCAACAARLAQAAKLYRGEFLQQVSVPGSVAWEEWALLMRERLRGQTLDVLTQLIVYHERREDDELARQYAWRALALEAWDEMAHRCLMRVFARSGQRADALAQYERCRHILAEELAIEPAAETTALYEQIRAGQYAKLPGRVAAAASTQHATRSAQRPTSSPPRNLPAQQPPLVGRKRELAELASLLQHPTCRLITVLGLGGSGKTRLAIRAARLAEEFVHGVYFVALASLSSADLLIPTIADAITFTLSETQDPREQFLSYLRDKQLLLVLDNFEHLLAGTGLLADILQHAPGVRMLVTSRERLHLHGEWVLEIAGLCVPESEQIDQIDGYDAVELFLQCARQAGTDLTLSPEERVAVIRICRLVGGLPLAIELAAAWVRVLPCADIAQELERNINLMTTSLRDVPERHRSLHAVFDHSWKLLSEEEKRTFGRLSVFPNSFGRDAAAQVAGVSLPLLSSLADKSLLSRNAAKRYEMHELVRRYAHERLLEAGELAATQRLHAHFFLTFAETADAKLRGADQQAWLSRIEAEHDNLRAALTWSLEDVETRDTRHETRDEVLRSPVSHLLPPVSRSELGLRLAGALWWAWHRRGYVSEGRDWMARALAQPQSLGATAERAKALNGAGYLAICQGDYTTAHALYEESLAIACLIEDRQAMAWAHYGMAGVSWFRGDPACATAQYEKSHQLFLEISDAWGRAWALAKLAEVTWHQDDIQGAIRYYDQSLSLFRELGDIWSTAAVLSMASMFAHQRDHARAVALYQEGLALCRKLGDKRGTANVLLSMATTAWLQGDYQQAQTLLEEDLELYRELGERRGIAEVLHRLSNVARDRGQLDRAVALLEESLSLLRQLGDKGRTAWALNGLGDAALNQGKNGWADSLYQESLAMFQELGDNWGRTVVLRNQGRAALSRNDHARAGTLLEESLALAHSLSFKQAIAWDLTGLGQVAARQGHAARAIALYRKSLSLYQDMAEKPGIAWCLEGLAGVAGSVGQAERAARLFGAAEALRDAIGMPVPPGERPGYDRDVAAAQAQLDAEAWAILWDAGHTMAIEEAIAEALEAPLDGRLGAAPRLAAPHVSANLPIPPTTLIGRERDIVAAAAFLRQSAVRLLTLTGPPGVGKTRLCLGIAEVIWPDFPDGVFFVALEPMRDAALVATAIAQRLDVKETGDRPLAELLRSYIRDKSLLLVLDNFEHVLPAATLVAELLAACPRLTILATSRAPLHIRAECQFPVAPLALPDLTDPCDVQAIAQSLAVALFVERAQAVEPSFKLQTENAATVATICARLEGLPLAIELAAVRIRTLPPSALLAQLDQRLAVLTDGPRDLPIHLQTLRGAIAWSYDLLDPDSQTLFRRLSVFVGGFTMEAAVAVCIEQQAQLGAGDTDLAASTAIAHELTVLCRHNLLRRQTGPNEESRFTMLEMIREYARERLQDSGEAESLRRRHATYYLTLAETALRALHGPDVMAWLARLEQEHDNLRAALGWCLEDNETGRQGHQESLVSHSRGTISPLLPFSPTSPLPHSRSVLGLQLSGALWTFWLFSNTFAEGRAWLETFIRQPYDRHAPTSAPRARALLGAGWLAYYQHDYASGAAYGTESLALYQQADDVGGRADALNLIGFCDAALDDYPAGIARLEESVALSRVAGDPYILGLALINFGFLHNDQGDIARAQPLFEESLAWGRKARHPVIVARALNALGELARMQGEYRQAGSYYEESLALYGDMRDRRGMATLHHNLGYVAQYNRDSAQAGNHFAHSLAYYREFGDQAGTAAALAGLAGVVGMDGQCERAARLFGAARALRDASGAPIIPPDLIDYERNVAAVRAQLDEATFAAAWAAGRAMPLEQTITLALSSGPPHS